MSPIYQNLMDGAENIRSLETRQVGVQVVNENEVRPRESAD